MAWVEIYVHFKYYIVIIHTHHLIYIKSKKKKTTIIDILKCPKKVLIYTMDVAEQPNINCGLVF